MRLPGRLVAGTALALAVGAAAFGSVSVQQVREQRAGEALATLGRATAELEADPVAPMLAIDAGEEALAAAAANGAPAERLAVGRGAFAAARDAALGIERLANLAPIGTLPAGVDPARATLVTLGQRVFLAGGGFYEVDPRRGFLIELIAPGQVVDGVPVGPIVDAAVDGAGVLLSDGAALYRQDDRGAWVRQPLAEPRWPVGPADGPSASFNRTLYAIAGGGSVVRYETDGERLSPWMWASAADYPDLAEARDIAVDERVHVLLADGRVLSFYRGVLEASGVPPIVPEAVGSRFFAVAPGSRALYLVDPEAAVGDSVGRLIRYDPGGRTQQFLAPIGSPGSGEGARANRLLAEARSVAVVEGAAAVYLLVGDELWRATMPPVVG
jgi:hypothetical protein